MFMVSQYFLQTINVYQYLDFSIVNNDSNISKQEPTGKIWTAHWQSNNSVCHPQRSGFPKSQVFIDSIMLYIQAQLGTFSI